MEQPDLLNSVQWYMMLFVHPIWDDQKVPNVRLIVIEYTYYCLVSVILK